MWAITIILAVDGVVKAKLNCWLQLAFEARTVTSAAGPAVCPSTSPRAKKSIWA